MNSLGRWALLVAVGLGVLTGCGAEEDGMDGMDGMDDRAQLDGLATRVDGLAADLVPAGERVTGSTVRSWWSEYRVCSDPAFTDVSYVVEVNYGSFGGDRGAAVRRLAETLTGQDWQVEDPDDRGLTASRDGVRAVLVAGPYGADLTLKTPCVEVDGDVGKEYGERASRDFLKDG